MELEYINFKNEDGIAWIQFNRPKKLNALNPAVIDDLEQAIAACEEDESIRVVVLKGSEKAFVAGADIEHMSKGNVNLALALNSQTMRVQSRLNNLPQPTVAAISGYALGGGCEVALCCDFRIAADNAVLGLPEITLGIIPGGGGTQRLPRLIGTGAAAKLIMLGEMIKADEAEKIGLVDRIVPLAEMDDEIKAFAAKLMERPAVALRAAKVSMRKGIETSLEEGLQIEQGQFALLFGTEDQKEGMGAFLEKRKPAYKGK
ncbi:MAG: enoyl-CoA hydratase [bacterium]|nr:enoyl-CoA hydratase [bacterium]